MPQSLCWFCGERKSIENLHQGHCLGRMVYSCDTAISAEVLEQGTFANQSFAHLKHDRCAICRDCVALFANKTQVALGSLSRHLSEREAALAEAIDYETGLIEWEDRKHLFSCWFDHFSSSDHDTHFLSLPLIDLFDRGLRFVGEIQLQQPQLRCFLDRFATADHLENKKFNDHIRKHFADLDANSISHFAGIRAAIFNLTVLEFALNYVDRPSQDCDG